MRFPGFEGEWEEKRTKEIAPLQRGFDLPLSEVDEGDYPVVYSNGVLRTHSEFKVKFPGVVTGRSGTIGKITYLEEDYWPHNTTLWVTEFRNNDPKFIYYFYSNFKLERYNAGSTVPTLNRNDVHFVKKRIPTFLEQTKIANFLTIIDSRIQTQNKIIEDYKTLKKGLMQKIFKQELRFKDVEKYTFSNWKLKKLSSLCERVSRKNKEDNKNVLTISAQLGLINQEEYFNKPVSAKNVTGYYLLEKNEFAYNKSYSKGYPMGAIKRLKKYEKGVVSTLYICFKFNIEISLEFMEQYFESGFHNHELSKVTQEGARNHGLLNIAVGDFFNTKLLLPSKDEQQKIASTLSSIDKKITLEEDYLKQLKAQKKYLLQNLFV